MSAPTVSTAPIGVGVSIVGNPTAPENDPIASWSGSSRFWLMA